jgi:hypothetical protein
VPPLSPVNTRASRPGPTQGAKCSVTSAGMEDREGDDAATGGRFEVLSDNLAGAKVVHRGRGRRMHANWWAGEPG